MTDNLMTAHWNRRKFLGTAALAVGAMASVPLLGACSTGSDSKTRKTTFTFAQTTSLDSMDPSSSDATEARCRYINIYDALIHRDANGKLVPSIATDWKNTDPTHWVFEIRKGVKFHDGTALTADDVVFSMKRYMDPKIYNGASKLESWEEVKALDRYTVQLTTKTPDVLVPAFIADKTYIMSEKYYGAHDKGYIAANANGTGPYTQKEWVKGNHVTLTANPNYWGGAPEIRTVVIKEILTDNTRASALLAGEIDLDPQIIPDQMSRLKGKSTIKVVSVDLPAPVYIGMHLSQSPNAEALSDVRVRQALNYAVDKDAIISRILKGGGTAMGCPIPSISFGSNPAVKPYPYDVEKAKSLLKEAGKTNLKLGFDLPASGLNGIHDPALAVAQYLEAAGVTVDVNVFDTDSYIQKLIGGNLDDVWAQIYRDATLDAGGIYNGRLNSTGPSNKGHYKDPQADKLISLATTTFDKDERLKAYNQLATRTHEQAPWIYLYNPKQATAMSSNVKFQPRADQLIPVAEAVSFV